MKTATATPDFATIIDNAFSWRLSIIYTSYKTTSFRLVEKWTVTASCYSKSGECIVHLPEIENLVSKMDENQLRALTRMIQSKVNTQSGYTSPTSSVVYFRHRDDISEFAQRLYQKSKEILEESK